MMTLLRRKNTPSLEQGTQVEVAAERLIGEALSKAGQRNDSGGAVLLWEMRHTVFSLDLLIGLIVGLVVGFEAGHTKGGLDNALLVITTEVLLGAGILAVVLAALAILATFFDDGYRTALRKPKGGFLAAVLPFKVVALYGAIASLSGIVTVALWASLDHALQAFSYGVVSGAAAAAVVGTWQLVKDTTFHGVKRAEIQELDQIEAYLKRRAGGE